MASGEATIRARISRLLKDDTDAVFQELGLSSSEAIRLFLNQVRLHRGLPFAVNLPPQEDASDLLVSRRQRQAALDLCYDD
jgi:DNA-damage-inducible protein J